MVNQMKLKPSHRLMTFRPEFTLRVTDGFNVKQF
uniref:Uncharacterized protein n=1 Tax=Anguilla anguilla TaxID=7936 RepID=A0A0E9PQL8_ANGAN